MEKLLEQYDKIFDKNGHMNFCSKNECVKLIELCEKQFPDVDFGNKGNGFLNVANIKQYVNRQYV